MNIELTLEDFGPSQNGSLNKAGVECNTSRPANSNFNKSDKKHRGKRAGQVFACLVGSLLLILTMIGAPATASARVAIGVSVSFGPPALPYYVQPPCPGPGYIWTPGYWAWDSAYGYYWVPGTWVPAPFVGALWTPGYWGFEDGAYFWHSGYWGLMVGYYGDIDYGHGYWGHGYDGGYWHHRRFFYNRFVNRIDPGRIRDFYYQRDHRDFRERRASFHGGPGGTIGGPTHAQLAARRFRRFGADRMQMRQRMIARGDPVQRASFNHGRPAIAATRRPGMFRGKGAVRASRAGAPYRPPSHRIMQNFRNARPTPNRSSNRRGFTRVQPFSARHYAAPRQRMQHRGPVRANRGRPAQRYNFRRGPFQARQQQVRRPNDQRGRFQARQPQMRRPMRFGGPQRHGPPQRQQMRRGGFQHGGGHGGHHDRGRRGH